MKLVNHQGLAALPAGTVYMRCVFDESGLEERGLLIKGETILDGDDWWVAQRIPGEYVGRYFDKPQSLDSLEPGQIPEAVEDAARRDASFDDTATYIVFENKDVQAVADALLEALAQTEAAARQAAAIGSFVDKANAALNAAFAGKSAPLDVAWVGARVLRADRR